MSDTTLPDPLVPADVDLRDFPGMWVDTDRLLRSDTWILGTSDEKAAAFTLWAESWHQVPAASLPNNDRVLAKLSQAERWSKSRAHALRGWVACSDGRLYHPVVAEKALEAWIEKLTAAISGAVGNAKRWQVDVDTTHVRAQFKTAVDTLRTLNPASKILKKKSVAIILAGSRPDSGGDSGPQSGGDSGGDRKGSDQTGSDQTRPDRNKDPLVGAEPPAPAPPDPPPAAGAAPTPPPAADRGSRLPKDWQLPKAWGDWALDEYPQWTADKVRREAASFRDHWASKTGKDATKLDWLATWRNWCRSDIAHRDDPKPVRTPAPPVDTATRNAEAKRLLGFNTTEELPHA